MNYIFEASFAKGRTFTSITPNTIIVAGRPWTFEKTVISQICKIEEYLLKYYFESPLIYK